LRRRRAPQIGNIFSDPAPRPPGNIPRGNQQQQPSEDEEEVPELPRGRVLPTPNRPPPGQACLRRERCSRSRWLRRPAHRCSQNVQPGIAIAATATRSGRGRGAGGQSAAGDAARQRQPRACRNRQRHCSPATRWSPSAGAEDRQQEGEFFGLDKITGRIINFDEDIPGQELPSQYGAPGWSKPDALLHPAG